jgi:hypothetical protein
MAKPAETAEKLKSAIEAAKKAQEATKKLKKPD